ncbi:MAG: dihydroorotase [Bacteroidetes bacterium]|nr:dihydroorotase [Bacteroidota bacterium]
MSSILIKSATISDPGNTRDGQKLDILLHEGTIVKMAPSITDTADQTIFADGYFLGAGFVDCFATCGEPGEEWKEDLRSLSEAASAGGFTSVAALCGTQPVSDSSAVITSVLEKSKTLSCRIMPLGTATKGKLGKELAEYFDMRNAGAVAVTDGLQSLNNAGMRSRIMEYAGNSEIPFLDFPFDSSLAIHGTMHDGIVSNGMGLKGIPTVSESTAIAECLKLAEWLKTPVRLLGVSSAESVVLIREAKKKGMEVYAAVPVLNLVMTDANLSEFDENCKVLPPLRTDKDRSELIRGLEDDTLDAVYSNHVPQDTENKTVEFEYAAFGASNIQVVFGMLLAAKPSDIDAEFISKKLASGPRKFLGMEMAKIEVGSSIDLTIFSTVGTWIWDTKTAKGKSKNSPFYGREIKGNVLGTVCKGKWQHQNQNENQ